MRRIAMVVAGLVLNAIWVYAGYESIPPPEVRGRQNVVKGERASVQVRRAGWGGGVVFADGTERGLENAGGHFLPITLEAGIQCRMWMAGPGLIPGRRVLLFTQCGGLINGRVMDDVAVGEDGFLRFDYQNGQLGSQPIQATLLGNTATLLLVNAVQNNPDSSDGRSP